MQRTVQDVMTRDVVVAHESTPFHGRLLRLPAHHFRVDVAGGVVTLTGRLERRSQAFGLAQLAGLVDGVVAVRDQLTYELDDLRTRKTTTAR